MQLFHIQQIQCIKFINRVSKLNNVKSEGSLGENIKKIYGEIGMAGLWRGLGARIFMIGTFACLGVTMILGYSTDMNPLGFGMFIVVFAVIVIIAGAISGASAMLLERVAYRRLRRKNASRLSSLISAIGASLFLIEVFRLMSESTDWAFPRLLESKVLFQISTAYIDQTKLFISFCTTQYP